MLALIIILLLVFWFLGYIRIASFPLPDFVLFSINGQSITLWNIIIFALIAWAIGILPSPLREIAGVLLLLWVLSTLGILAIAGLSSIIVITIIIGLVLSLLGAI